MAKQVKKEAPSKEGPAKKSATKRPSANTATTQKGTASARKKEKPSTSKKTPPPNLSDVAAKTTQEIMEQAGHIGSLITKGIDLTQAGLSFGIGLLNSFTLMQQQVVGKVVENVSNPKMPIPSMSEGESIAEPSSENAPAPPQPQGVMNRLPLVPGGNIYVPFSINNDSVDAVKQLSVRLEGLVGSMHRAVFPLGSAVVMPESVRIGPVDFEKFVINGTVPADLPPDTYCGYIAVVGEDSFQIPVTLHVGAAAGPRTQ